MKLAALALSGTLAVTPADFSLKPPDNVVLTREEARTLYVYLNALEAQNIEFQKDIEAYKIVLAIAAAKLNQCAPQQPFSRKAM